MGQVGGLANEGIPTADNECDDAAGGVEGGDGGRRGGEGRLVERRGDSGPGRT